ncbi:hypothetical protein [Streptomyces sp. NPDC047841]|uniref:hypothetical protein n=1 Tax=Streptomyces sp. NPDC047841 TaxID=3154708 RepID=UPI0034512197
MQDLVNRAARQCISRDPQLRASYERTRRHRLGATVVDRLNPAVTVHDLAPVGEAVSTALARADAATRNEPEPEHYQSLELGSEA